MVRPANLEKHEFIGLRAKVANFIEDPRCVNFIATLILLNAVTLGLETSDYMMARFQSAIRVFDFFILGVFVIEISLKLYLYRVSFFRQGWNVFDFLVVGVALIPASGPYSVLRAFRVLRVLRLMSVVPQMRRVITALFLSIPGMASIIGVLMIIFYVCAVLATQIFGAHPSNEMQELFGTIGASMYTLFQIMTLEGWSENIAMPTMEYFPWSWAYFVVFIVVTSFAVLNLFIGIIVDAMNIVQEEDLKEERLGVTTAAHKDSLAVKKEIRSLRKEIAELKELMTGKKMPK
jgi:voltage-gated sodium channel